ncbi:MAG: hypothetical protein J6C55_04725 [Oscillospiraceae bacterium]|nr:hypothetical protein [Oscillospiraceae bacterium]
MIDFHTHILPGIDDGAVDESVSIEMIDILNKNKITDIILTPHFYSDVQSLDDFISQRDKKYSELLKNYKGDVKLHLGAEVFISEYLSRYQDLSCVCIGREKKYMLLELPLSSKLSSQELKIIETLIFDYQITPIIAHVERYSFMSSYSIKDLSKIDALISLGCFIQVNAESFLVKNNKLKKFVLFLLETDRAHLLGSDSHDLKIRTPENYYKAIEVINSKLGQDCLDRIKNYEDKIIKK